MENGIQEFRSSFVASSFFRYPPVHIYRLVNILGWEREEGCKVVEGGVDLFWGS